MNVIRNNNIAVVSRLKVSLQEIVFLIVFNMSSRPNMEGASCTVYSLKQIHWFGMIWEYLGVAPPTLHDPSVNGHAEEIQPGKLLTPQVPCRG